jgi:cystathionine beta-lyase/cystathionine gamma-synthase
MRGAVTLPLRMRQHNESAQKVAEFLQNHHMTANMPARSRSAPA